MSYLSLKPINEINVWTCLLELSHSCLLNRNHWSELNENQRNVLRDTLPANILSEPEAIIEVCG